MLLLTGAGYFGYHQTVALGAANEKVEQLESTIVSLNDEISENNRQLRSLNADNQRLEREKAKNTEKALKDLARVEKIAKSKSLLYEKLVNRDFRATQEEFRGLMQ